MFSLFESFCEMMDTLPAAAVKKAAAVERRVLEEDTAMGREESVCETASILAFCRFLESAGDDNAAFPPNMPLEHWSHYTRIVLKLVQAGELSPAAKDHFEGECGKVLLHAFS
jgi:hypothetical protein